MEHHCSKGERKKKTFKVCLPATVTFACVQVQRKLYKGWEEHLRH